MNWRTSTCRLALMLFAVAAAGTVEAQDDAIVEATSLTGKPLYRLALDDQAASELEDRIASARAQRDASPNDLDLWIWLGRRLAYAGRYRESIEVYSEALARFGDRPQLLRHRGHRLITVRQFDPARKDLLKAAEMIRDREDAVELDGIPNAAGTPTSTLHTNIYYHVGLVHYLQRDFEAAAAAYRHCLDACTTDDMRIATIDWLYLTLRRLDRDDEAEQLIAQIGDDFQVIENHSYLRRVRMYQGKLEPSQLLPSGAIEQATDVELATYGYALGMHYGLVGDREQSRRCWRRVLAGKQWAAFGYIAAEAEEWAMRD